MVHEVQHIGLVVIFGVIMIPVYAMILGWLIGNPRDGRTAGLGIGYLFGFLVFVLVATWIAGLILGVIMHW